MNFYKGIFGRWVSGFGLLMALSGGVLAQGPWEFNGDTSGWTVLNSALTAGDNAVDLNLSTGSIANNRITIAETINTATAPSIIAVTLKNTTANAAIIFALNKDASGNANFGYKRVTASNVGSNDSLPKSASDFTTFYYDLDDHSKWNGTNVIEQLLIRFKTAGGNTGAASTGNIYIDKIELLSAVPSSSPTMTITSSTSGVTDGSSSGNSSINLVFAASEVTTDFDESDISVTNGRIENFTGIEDSDTGMTYTATFIPSSAGATTIDVAAGAFTGATSSASNLAVTQFNWEKTEADNSAPTLATVTAVETTDNDSTPDFVFSSDEAGTITSSLGFSTTTDAISGNNTITLNSLVDGVYYGETVTVTDAASNAATLTIPTFFIDTSAPTISSASISSDNSTDTLGATGDSVTLTFSVNRSLERTPAVVFTSGGDAATNNDTVTSDSGNYTITVPSDKSGSVSGTLANSFEDRGLRFVRPPVNSEAPEGTWGTATQADATRVGGNIFFRKFTWSNANSWCESISGRLATEAEVTTHLLPLLGSSSNGYWEAELKWPQQFSHYWTATVAGDNTTDPATRHKAFITKNYNSGADVYEFQGRADATTKMWPMCVVNFERNFTSTYTVDASDTDGAVTYTVDAIGALGTNATQVTSGTGSVTVDKAAPTMAISSSTVSSGAASNDSSIALTFISNEATTNFVEGDLTVSGGTISSFSASSLTVYTATFTASSDGATSIDVAAGAFTDAAGNSSTAATQFTWTSDATPPTMTISSAAVSNGATSNASSIAITFTSSESTGNFSVGDVTVGNGSLSGFSGSGSSYSATVTPSSDDVVTVNVGGSSFTDAFGNNNSAATQFGWTYDGTAPVISLSGQSSVSLELGTAYTDAGATATDSLDGTLTSSITTVNPVDVDAEGTYTVTYNVSDGAGNAANQVTRTVTITPDVTVPVITLTGNASVNVLLGNTYTDAGATATDNTDGTITGNISTANPVDVNTEGTYTVTYDVSDAAGNAATQVTRTVTVTSSPIMTISSSTVSSGGSTNTDPIGVVFSSSKTTTDFSLSDVSVSGGSLSNLSGSDKTYTATFTASGDGAKTINIAAGGFTNSSGNGNVASEQFSYTYDSTFPTLDTSKLLLNISEGTSGLGRIYADESVTWSVTGDGVSVNSAGSLTLSSPADFSVKTSHSFTVKGTDAVGNSSSVPVTVEVDDISSPVLDYSGLVKSINDGGTALGTITADEPVTWSIAGSGVSINQSGEVSLDSPADFLVAQSHEYRVTATDKQGGAATIAYSFIVEVIDITAPNLDYSGLVTSIDDGGTALGTITADEPVTWSISGSGVSISTAGVVTLDSAADFLVAESHEYRVTAKDKQGGATKIGFKFIVEVIDVTPPEFDYSDLLLTVDEGTTALGTIKANEPVNWTVSGTGVSIDSEGAVTLDSPAKWEDASYHTYKVTATDKQGGAGRIGYDFTANVNDKTAPVITLVGDSIVNIELGTEYTDAGATAVDNKDGTVTDDIVTVSKVNTDKVGTYTVTYNVTDAAGNVATEVTRTVTVTADATKPVITLNSAGGEPTTVTTTTFDISIPVDKTGNGPDGKLGNATNDLAADNVVVKGSYVSGNLTFVRPPVGAEALSATWGTAAGRDLTRVGTNLYFRKFTHANAVLWCESVNGRLATAPEITEHLLPKVGNNGDGTWETDLNWPQQAAHYWTSTVAGDNTADPANRHKAFITYNTNNGNSVHAMQGRADTTKYWPLCVETGTTTTTTTGGEASPTLTHEQGTTYTDAGATAVDNIDGDITANIVTVNPVDSSAAGIYVVTYNVSDAAGNRADEVTRTVTVSDTQVPVITLTGAQSASVEVGYSYVDAGATASDVADGDLTASITAVSDVDTSVVGTYTVTYNVSDAAGNVAAQVTRTVQVTADVTVPVITLIGSNVSLELGSIYTDAGATASDNIDGDISATIVTVSDVNTGAVGTYTVTYNVSDAAGNAAAEVTRTVTVTPDVTIPVITLLGDASVSLELGTAYTDAGATAVDNIDGDISASITAVSTVDINTAGTYSVTYSVSDASGNAAAEVSRSVTITPDATKPTITLVGDATVELVVGRVYTDAGATATDNIDGNITASIVVVSTVDANTVGTYTVTYGVSDAAGNAADEVTRTVIVSPFIINLEVPADLVVDATGYLTAVDLGTATATDGDGNAVSVSADQTGPFESGAYTITWTATDADGNTTSETQSLKVNPLANLSPSRSTAEGATPEVKVQLSGMAPTYPVVVPFSISGTATEGDDYTVTQSGSISIAAGSSGVINLTIANDEVAESDETVVITITDPSNAALGSVTQQTLTIVDGNVPPAVELSVSQGDVVGSSVVADLGAVVISVSIDDPNPTDSHTVDWGDGLNLPGAVADPSTKTLSFSAAGMVGVTTITADVSDGTDSVMASVSVNVLESAPILASDVDSDGDGISDAEEGYGDSDGDGIPDYADNITVPNAAPSDGGVVETEPGTQITLGSLSLANGDNDISVAEDDLVELGIEPDADYDYPAGLIDFTISGAEPGASYNLVVPLAISIPVNSEYRKYFNEDIGWRAFATVTATGMDPLNSIASALAVDGACPGIDSDAYVSGVNAGDNCLRLTIEDGGPNDVDMTANGTLVDPGGIASFGDGTAPVITLLGDASVSVEVGNAYVDAGATAEDAVDGDISASITADSSVDVDTVGTYTVTYNVSDAAGNAAVEVTRTVSVVLGTPSTSSTAVLSRSGLIANGTDSTTVTVTALNDQGGALRQMTVSGSFGLGSVSAFTEQGDGVYTATVTAGTSIGAGPVTVTITNGQDSVSINSGQIQIRAAEKPRSSGGGGCAVATDGSSDSSLVLVLMLLGMLMLRRRKRSS